MAGSRYKLVQNKSYCRQHDNDTTDICLTLKTQNVTSQASYVFFLVWAFKPGDSVIFSQCSDCVTNVMALMIVLIQVGQGNGFDTNLTWFWYDAYQILEPAFYSSINHCFSQWERTLHILTLITLSTFIHYPRPVWNFGYGRCLRLSVRPSVSPSVSHQVCPRDNSSTV